MNINDPLGEEFDKTIAKIQRTALISYFVSAFTIVAMATLGGVAVHFLRKVW